MLAFLNKLSNVLQGMQSLIPQADKKPMAFLKLIYPVLCILSQGRSYGSLWAHSGTIGGWFLKWEQNSKFNFDLSSELETFFSGSYSGVWPLNEIQTLK